MFLGPQLTLWKTLQDPDAENGGGFGSSLALGDVDQDGNPDLIVGAGSTSVSGVDGAGKVFVFPGPDLDTAVPLVDPTSETGGGFGSSVSVGDIDGDGYDDVVVGATGNLNQSGDMEGETLVFRGPDLEDVVMLRAPAPAGAATFGSSVAAVDVDGDGDAEVAVGAAASSPEGVLGSGEVFVFRDPTGTSPSLSDAFSMRAWARESAEK